MKLHLLTAITRPENLGTMAASLAAAQQRAPSMTVVWHMRADPGRQHVGGQALKNEMLEEISDGWVWIFDDDNAMHPAMLESIARTIGEHMNSRMLVIAQRHRLGAVRRVHRAMLRQTHVDAGQVVVRRDAIGDWRIPLHYCGDGEWIEGLAGRIEDEQIAYIHAPVVYYNWLKEC